MFRAQEYAHENYKTRPRNQRVMKKTRLDTASKTIKHKCSQCERKDAKKYPVSEKEVRWLCPLHIAMFERKNVQEKPNFIKGSMLNH